MAHEETHFHRPGTGQTVLSYTLLPGFWPRLKTLFGGGRLMFAVYIAQIFAAVGLLPRSHAYLNSSNFGRYRFRHVMAEASSRLTWNWRNADRILIYFAVLTGVILLFVQVFILMMAVFMVPVWANVSADFNSIFFMTADQRQQDYSLRLLDLVFGLPGVSFDSFFGSCVPAGDGVPCLDYRGEPLGFEYNPVYPFPQHDAFFAVLGVYNYALIIVGFIVMLYYLVTLLAETAVTGVYMGQRQPKFWVPVRVAVFMLLLLPVLNGVNFAQLVTLNAAYYGTNIASNAWRLFNAEITDTVVGDAQDLVATPTQMPGTGYLLQFMSIVRTCQLAEQRINNNPIEAYIVSNQVIGNNCLPLEGTPFSVPDGSTAASAQAFSNFEDITIRFGTRAAECSTDVGAIAAGAAARDDIDAADIRRAAIQEGSVIPHCGELIIPAGKDSEFASLTQEANYLLIQDMWANNYITDIGAYFYYNSPGVMEPPAARPTIYIEDLLDPAVVSGVVFFYDSLLEDDFIQALDDAIDADFFAVPASLEQCGWVCAGLWFNRIAELNGDLIDSLLAVPEIRLWPRTMQEVISFKEALDINLDISSLAEPVMAGPRVVPFEDDRDLEVAQAISANYSYWFRSELQNINFADGGADAFRPTMNSQTGSPIIDAVQIIFGVSGLFDMRENADVHPLAQLSILGKGMVESVLLTLAGNIGISIAGGLGDISQAFEQFGQLQPLGGVLTSIMMVGLTIGFLLYYVIPFLPFIYFIFAVSGWIKGVFEAMVGIPLWALAHLRLDGEGLIGQAANAGYFLLLEIMLRPVMIVIALIASVSIFAAMVRVLNEIFDLVVANVGGFNVAATAAGDPGAWSWDLIRSPIDQFFYTAVYAIIVYMLALTVFKLIDQIPNQIMRWAGEDVQTFGEMGGDPSEELVQKLSSGITLVSLKGSALLGASSRQANANIDDE